ncbi:MAG TPA: TonB-dependent receptor [Caulobacteraceae bacterium]
MAYAADAAATDTSTSQVGEVVVTGQRAALKSAQTIKKDSDQIVDSITAVDIGALPDRSVSEALQRIPGVTLQRTNEAHDPARLASEGGAVFIRGVSWVRSELNGRDIFSANNGRDLSFEDVSADLLAGVDVYKNASAELVEGGIGGIVNLRTRLPFDSHKRLLAVSADYNYADLRKKGYFSANGLFSDRWDTSIGEVGLLLSASLGNIGNRTDSIQTGRYEPRTLGVAQDGHAAGSTVYIPNSVGWRRVDWQQRRTAYAGALQWSPRSDLTFTAQAFYAKADPHDIEHALGDVQGDFPTDNTSYKFNSQGVVTAGTVNGVGIDADTRFGQSHKRTGDYSLNFKWTPNDRWAVSGDVQYVQSHSDVLSMTAFTELGAGNRPSLAFDLSGNTPVLKETQSPNLISTQSAYWWAAAMDHLERNDAHEWAERADAVYAFEDQSWLKSFRFGARATQKDAITRESGWNWNLLSAQYWGASFMNPVYLNQTGFDATHQSSALPGASQLFSYDGFFRGNVQLPGVAWFPTDALVSNGTANAYNILKNTESSGWGWTPLSGDFSQAHPGSDNPNGGINNQAEHTQAVYGVLAFGHDKGILGPFDGNVGLRIIHTQAEGIGLLTIGSINGTAAACALSGVDCTAFNKALAFASGGNVPGFKQSNSYTDVLPSFNVRFHLTEKLQLRLAASKAIVRPSFSQMMPYTTLSFDFGTNFTPNPTTGAFIGNGGNPKLKPIRANNYDASLEWYFAPAGSVTFAAFYKDIHDYIFLGQDQETYTSGGQTLTFDVTRNMNGSHGTIKGFELAYTQFYDFLPGALSGLGMQASFTYIDSSGGKNTAINILEPEQVAGAADATLPLEGLSKTSFNVEGMYEKYGISARLAYNWRQRYLLTTSAANIKRPVWSEDYGQLDGSIFYSITPQVKVGIQATNLLNSRTYLDVGGAVLAPRYSWTDTDRRVAVALRASF